MYRLAHTEYLIGLAAVLLFWLVYYLRQRWRHRALKNLARKKFRKVVVPRFSGVAATSKFVLFSLGWIFLIIGLSNPQIGTKLIEAKQEGIDLVLAIDVSNSMLAEDIRPSRLERTKLGLEKLVDRLKGDRVGIIVFAGKAYVQLPITSDYAAAKLFINTLSTKSVSQQGTAIGTAIDLAVDAFDHEAKTSKAVIVVTDGENHEDNAVEAAKRAAEKGIRVYTIGMGSPDGAPIPIYRGSQIIGYKTDRNGNTVVTKLNEDMLREIAEAGNGKFIRASTGSSGMLKILDELESLQKQEINTRMFSDYEDRFQLFLAAALVFFLLWMLWPEKRLAFWDRIKLFEPE